MQVKCFKCDALIQADDADAVVDAFLLHGQQEHHWSYPEQAIRNYARNYAEAVERLTGPTERLRAIGRITIHPVPGAAAWVEGYPHNEPQNDDAHHFRGSRTMYDARGFQPIMKRDRDTIMRLAVKPTR